MQRYRLKALTRGEIRDANNQPRVSSRAPYCLVLAPENSRTHGTAVMVDLPPRPVPPEPVGYHPVTTAQRNAHSVEMAVWMETFTRHQLLMRMLGFTRGYRTWIDLYPHEDNPCVADVGIWTRKGQMSALIERVTFAHPLMRLPTHQLDALPYDPDVEIQDAMNTLSPAALRLRAAKNKKLSPPSNLKLDVDRTA